MSRDPVAHHTSPVAFTGRLPIQGAWLSWTGIRLPRETSSAGLLGFSGCLSCRQAHIGDKCCVLLKALTDKAIDDLVDQATGSDDQRKREGGL